MHRGDMAIAKTVDILRAGVRLIEQLTPLAIMIRATAASLPFRYVSRYCLHIRLHFTPDAGSVYSPPKVRTTHTRHRAPG